METVHHREGCSRTRGTRSGGGARHESASSQAIAGDSPRLTKRKSQAEYKAAQERHARAARELAEAEKRRTIPDEVDGFVLVRDLANPTGADPPVPPPEYCVVSIAAD